MNQKLSDYASSQTEHGELDGHMVAVVLIEDSRQLVVDAFVRVTEHWEAGILVHRT